MARNEEKAQSMLYRFREAQAAELGLGTRGDRRPRMASACKSLRDCERWRGEILREISRKVSKIQDAGLTDYEVRDLNDEINRLMREKRHWENQIVALGGANYRRNVAMLDDDGKEVPGTKGYKYFGRAKDLPGVKELFQSRKKEEEEETQALSFYKKFMNQGPAYYGDLDEADGRLLEFERAVEDEEWEEAYTNLREALNLSTDDPIPPMPRPPPSSSAFPPSELPAATPASNAKRKAGDGDVDGADSSADDGNAENDSAKRLKKQNGNPSTTDHDTNTHSTANGNSNREIAMQYARMVAAHVTFLDSECLLPPKMPTREEMEGVLLGLRKKALVEEYFGHDQG